MSFPHGEMAAIFLALPLAVLLGSMSPGPSFVVVARAAASNSRTAGVLAAMAMGTGSVVFSTAALLGLARLLAASPWLYLVLKIIGASYLLWLAQRLWRTAPQPLEIHPADGSTRPRRQWFTSAFLAQITNPKTAVFYAGVFASLLPTEIPAWAFFVLPALVFTIEATWYTLVALAFSRPSAKRIYLRMKTGIDRAAAGVVGALGVRLAVTLTQRGA